MRVYKGEISWFPGILGTGPNAEFMMSLAENWEPRMSIYFQMALTEDMRKALRKYQDEIVQPLKEKVYLNKCTPDEALEEMNLELDKVYSEIPKDERLVEDADPVIEDLIDYARETGQRVK